MSAHEVAAYEVAHPEENLTERDESGKEVLPAPVRHSLALLLVSIALWFIGYNAMETWFTTYAAAEWGMALGDASRCLIVANLGAIVSYIPVGSIASRVGRKRTILVGICMIEGTIAGLAAGVVANGIADNETGVLEHRKRIELIVDGELADMDFRRVLSSGKERWKKWPDLDTGVLLLISAAILMGPGLKDMKITHSDL